MKGGSGTGKATHKHPGNQGQLSSHPPGFYFMMALAGRPRNLDVDVAYGHGNILGLYA